MSFTSPPRSPTALSETSSTTSFETASPVVSSVGICDIEIIYPNLGNTDKVGAQESKPNKAKQVKDDRMSGRYWVETSPTGRQQFVALKRSQSHGHHHRHRHYDRDYYKVSIDEWTRLMERERDYAEENQKFAAENKSLKANLSAVQTENIRLSKTVIPQLQSQISCLYNENEDLRRANCGGDDSSRYHRQVERLQEKVAKLERDYKDVLDENNDFRHRLRELSKQLDGNANRRVEELKKNVSYWKNLYERMAKRYDDLLVKYDSLQSILEVRTRKMQAYEDILKRHRIL